MIPFKPVVEHKHDGAFLTEHPIDTIKKGKQANVPLVVGLNTEDGALRAAGTKLKIILLYNLLTVCLKVFLETLI